MTTSFKHFLWLVAVTGLWLFLATSPLVRAPTDLPESFRHVMAFWLVLPLYVIVVLSAIATSAEERLDAYRAMQEKIWRERYFHLTPSAVNDNLALHRRLAELDDLPSQRRHRQWHRTPRWHGAPTQRTERHHTSRANTTSDGTAQSA